MMSVRQVIMKSYFGSARAWLVLARCRAYRKDFEGYAEAIFAAFEARQKAHYFRTMGDDQC